MAPQIGPKEAPIRPKTPAKFPATPVTARMILTTAPSPTEMNGLRFGLVVLKLLAAIKEEKQAPGKAARVKPIITMANIPGESFFSSAAVIWTADASTAPVAWAPAITMHETPAVKTMAMMMPTMPPMLTSLLFRLLMQISTPAARSEERRVG